MSIPVKAYTHSDIYVPVEGLPQEVIQELMVQLRLPNPKAVNLARMDKAAWGVPSHLNFYQSVILPEVGHCLKIPRGADNLLDGTLLSNSYSLELEDWTNEGDTVQLHHNFSLRYYQEEAIASTMDSERGGILVSPPGSGKTVMGLGILSAIGRRAIWLTHVNELVDQAVSRIKDFFTDIQEGDIGVIGGGKCTVGKKITVATIQSLMREIPQELIDSTGVLVLDEAHHAPANTFAAVVAKFPCRYRIGLTATPRRYDGLTKAMFWAFGPQLIHVSREELAEEGYILLPNLVIRDTGFYGEFLNDKRKPDYATLMRSTIVDVRRNAQVLQQLIPELDDQYSLIISGRKSHCTTLYDALVYEYPGASAEVLTSSVPKKKRREIIQSIYDRKLRSIFATSIAEEGLDIPHLSRLHLVTPTRNPRMVSQAAGRVMRPASGKTDAIIYDYVDKSPIAINQFEDRKWIYAEECGIVV